MPVSHHCYSSSRYAIVCPRGTRCEMFRKQEVGNLIAIADIATLTFTARDASLENYFNAIESMGVSPEGPHPGSRLSVSLSHRDRLANAA